MVFELFDESDEDESGGNGILFLARFVIAGTSLLLMRFAVVFEDEDIVVACNDFLPGGIDDETEDVEFDFLFLFPEFVLPGARPRFGIPWSPLPTLLETDSYILPLMLNLFRFGFFGFCSWMIRL